MSETHRIADLMMAVVEGDPWHGSSAVALLTQVSCEEATSRLAPGAHSIWELVLHMTGWADEVRARLDGKAAGAPRAGDWPDIDEVTPAAWARAQRDFAQSHARLAAALRATRDERLDTPVLDHRDAAAGTGQSHYATVHGLVHHTAYHAGQVALLARLAESMRCG